MGRLLTADNQDARIKRSYFPNGLIKTDSLRIQTVARDDWEQHKYGLRYAYDLDGRRDSLFIPHQLRAGSDTVIAYTYDPQLGLLQTLRDLQSNRYDVSYTLRGELRSILYPAQYSEVLSYDADGRLQADTIRNPGPYTYPPFFNVTLARATRYSYDAQGRVLRSGDPLRFKDTLDVEYTGLGHLRRSHLSQWGCAQYCYFEGDRYATAEVYEQDALANRTYGVVSDTTGVSPRNPTWHDAFWVYVPGSGRLTEEAPGVGLPHRHFEYDSSGNNVFSYALSTAAPSTERASFFAADGSLRQVDSRWAVSLAAGDGQEQRYAVEDYRYDALGRRVWLRARKWCEGNWYDWRAGTECSTGLLRRTIWDGERELAEIQMPWALQNHGVGSAGSDDTTQQRSWWENDDTVPVNLGTLALDAYPPADPNPYFGHVIYSGQRGIDQPLAITRVNYVQALDWDPPRQARYKVWGPSTIVPFWNARGDAPQGIYSNGAFILCDPPTSTVTCVALEWPYVWSAYDRQQRPSAQEYWQGTLLEGKRDKSGFDYRRNRYYDPTTGRFTQEDPVGLAGGINLYGFAKGDPVNFADPFGLKPCPGRLKKLAGRLQMLAFKIVQYRNSYRRGIADQDHFDRIKDEQDGLNKDLDAYHRDDCDDDDNDFRRLRNQAMSFSREKLPEPQMRYGPQRDYMQVLVPGFGIAPGLTPTVPEFPVFEVPPFPVFEVPIVTVFP